jgi:hypothetical protein
MRSVQPVSPASRLGLNSMSGEGGMPACLRQNPGKYPPAEPGALRCEPLKAA